MKILKFTTDLVDTDNPTYGVYQFDTTTLHFRLVYSSSNYWKAFSFYLSIKDYPSTVTLLVER